MGNPNRTSRRLAELVASTVAGGFEASSERFDAITARARSRFEQCDWHGMMADMGERLEHHSIGVDQVIARLRGIIGGLVHDASLWREARTAYATQVAEWSNRELAETFFNSVARRVLKTVGISATTEFDREELQIDPDEEIPATYYRHLAARGTEDAVRRALKICCFAAPFEEFERDVRLTARAIEAEIAASPGAGPVEALEIVRPVFFRQKLAYVVGRVRAGNTTIPLVISLRNGSTGIAVDAVLTTPTEMSVIFSFTRSHFHVEVSRPRDLVAFLKNLMPLKPVAELYIALGFHKYGKTEMYRNLRGYLRNSTERIVFARGTPGMVMLVFTLPDYDYVFKVIRDRFAYPKTNTREEVIDRYQLVFRHDRVGRLVEAQEYAYLEFRADRFEPEVLQELLDNASRTVALRDGTVLVKHVYVERKVTPLNLYLREAAEPEVHTVLHDYGDAVKELASANIFPGDLLEKNFGVTRHGRVVFYDYDELCLMTECNFRRLPAPRGDEDEMAAEPWFAVGESDIFPEEFARFLGMSNPQQETFKRHHPELFDPAFWLDIQERIMEGEILDVYPYPREKRLRG
jgi:isocitrate dehydrogenase kinase/phosphatase